jgi:putative nucleotidyltransferase with HDIG domain
MCSVLRTSAEYSWLDRRVYDRTVDLHETIVELAEMASPLRLEFEPTRLRMGEEVFDRPPRGVLQLLGLYRRKGIRALEIDSKITLQETMVLHQILQSRSATIDADDRGHLEHVKFVEGSAGGSLQMPSILTRSRLGRVLQESEEEGDEVRTMVAEITQAIDGLSPPSQQTMPPGMRVSRPSSLVALVGEMGAAAEVTLILASLRRHDEYTYDHSINVGLLSIALARAFGWKGRDLHEFGVAALIHDIGKIYTPLEVLNKPGRFTAAEWVVMKKHPRDGYEILLEGGVGNELAPRIALEHHISYDGTGYPPVSTKDIHIGSHMVKIADVYDAFTTIRPYRSQARPQEVLKMLRKQAGTQFHPDLIEAFCAMMGEYAIGSTVKLRSGYIGLVVEPNLELPDRPLVRVLQDERGRKPKGLRLIDLSDKDPAGQYVDEVVECIDPVIRNIPIGRYI